MEYKYIKISLDNIIPAQHFLSIKKYKQMKNRLKNRLDYGNIYVIEYKNKIFSIDGHHRLYYLFEKGIKEVDVICELIDNESILYQILAEESLELGLTSIADLKSRFIESEDEYKKLWKDKCQIILKNLEK